MLGGSTLCSHYLKFFIVLSLKLCFVSKVNGTVEHVWGWGFCLQLPPQKRFSDCPLPCPVLSDLGHMVRDTGGVQGRSSTCTDL